MFGGQNPGQQQQHPINNSHRSSMESALTFSGIMNVYNQHGSVQVPRRPKRSEEDLSLTLE